MGRNAKVQCFSCYSYHATIVCHSVCVGLRPGPYIGRQLFFTCLPKKYLIDQWPSSSPLDLSPPYHAKKNSHLRFSPTRITDMLSVTVSRVTRRFHQKCAVKSPAVVVTASGPAERIIANTVRKKIKHYYNRLRGEGRFTCYHWEVRPGPGGEGEIVVIAMYPPTIVEFYDKSSHLSEDAVVIPVCMDCEDFSNTASLW